MNYYKSITDLPLSRFIDCLVDKNVYALVITGEVEKEVLQGAWEGIMSEYNDAMMGGEDKLHFNLLKEVELLKIDIQKVNMCIQVLNAEITFPAIVVPEKRFSNDLNKLTESNFPFDQSKPEQFRTDLKRAGTRAKSLLIKLGLKQANLDAINTKNNTKVTKPTKEYFYSILNTLSMFCKFQLSDNITVFSFCDWVRKSNEHAKLMEAQNTPPPKRKK